jgi:Fic family protein
MSDLAKLKEEATALNIQFPSNITYEKLLQRIEAVKALQKAKEEENNPNPPTIQTQNNSDEIDKSAGPEDKETNLQKKIDELQEEDEQEEDTLIKRVSKCGNYRVKIKGLEETARRSGVTIEDLKSVLGTGKLLNNFTFEIA